MSDSNSNCNGQDQASQGSSAVQNPWLEQHRYDYNECPLIGTRTTSVTRQVRGQDSFQGESTRLPDGRVVETSVTSQQTARDTYTKSTSVVITGTNHPRDPPYGCANCSWLWERYMANQNAPCLITPQGWGRAGIRGLTVCELADSVVRRDGHKAASCIRIVVLLHTVHDPLVGMILSLR